jgi:hypothetical protein
VSKDTNGIHCGWRNTTPYNLDIKYGSWRRLFGQLSDTLSLTFILPGFDQPHIMSAHTHFPQANAEYVANFGDKGSLGLPPAKKLIVGP